MPTKKHDAVAQSDSDPQTVIATPECKTKTALLLDLISRQGGATLDELTSATGWLPHTARAAITGLRKRGHDVRFDRTEGARRYIIGSDGISESWRPLVQRI